MSFPSNVSFDTSSIRLPEGFLQKKGRFTWATRYFRLHIDQSKPEVSLRYNKTYETCWDDRNPNKYWLNVENVNLKNKTSDRQLTELHDDELLLEGVVQESARHPPEASAAAITLKLKFGSIFYRELWEKYFQTAIAAVPKNSELSKKKTRDVQLPVPQSQEHRGSPSASPPPDPKFTNCKHVACDFSEVSDIVAMSCSRSVNIRNLCQRLVQLGQRNARYSFKYNNVDLLIPAEDPWLVDPRCFGLLEIVKNLLRQPPMFALMVGTLGQMSAVTCIIASHCIDNKLRDGPLKNKELWVKAQDHLITTVDFLLEEVVKNSKSISRLGSVSLLLLELTSARMSLVATPSGQQMVLAKGVFNIVKGLANSIVSMRLDPSLLSGLGVVATSSLALLKEGWAKDFCIRLSSIASLPDFCTSSQLSCEALRALRYEVVRRFHSNLFITRSNFFEKSSSEILEISRWEFHAAFAVMLTKLVVQLSHENLMLINCSNKIRSKDTLRQVSELKAFPEVFFFPLEDGRFVLEKLLEKLDEAPFVDVETFLRHLKDTDGNVSNLVQLVFKNKEEVLRLNDFHQNEQHLVAAVRQIDEPGKQYTVPLKLKENVPFPVKISPTVGTQLTEELITEMRRAGVQKVTVKRDQSAQTQDAAGVQKVTVVTVKRDQESILPSAQTNDTEEIHIDHALSRVLMGAPLLATTDMELTEQLILKLRAAGISQVTVVAADQPDEAFNKMFASYPSFKQSAKIISHSKSLISNMLYGFDSSCLKTAQDTSHVLHLDGPEQRVKGLIDLACYGLDASFDSLDSHPGFKLASWADKVLAMTSNEKNLFQEGLMQLKEFVLNTVVRHLTQFDADEISNEADAQTFCVAHDRRTKALEITKEKLTKTQDYVNRFSDLIKLLPLGSASQVQPSDGENESIRLFESVKIAQLKENRATLIQAAETSRRRLAADVLGLADAKVLANANSLLTKEVHSPFTHHPITLHHSLFNLQLCPITHHPLPITLHPSPLA